ncbi:MAG TPA: hypothetical protein VEI08_00415, partial [Candidatus Bathyarchaeia archaeon]|nr:hypothetical protein [Candidatus Bathyarchaeia archaeon]
MLPISCTASNDASVRWPNRAPLLYKFTRTITPMVRIAPALVTRPKNDRTELLVPLAPHTIPAAVPVSIPLVGDVKHGNTVPMPVKFGVFVRFDICQLKLAVRRRSGPNRMVFATDMF